MDRSVFDKLTAVQRPEGFRVFPAEIDGRRVYIKRTEKNFPNRAAKWASALLDGISRRERLTPIEHEANRIRMLADAGFIVPDIVIKTDDYIVLSDIGPTLESVIAKVSPQEREEVLRAAARSLRALHDKGGWHGAAALRNMTQAPDGIGFIDLENRVDAYIPLFGRQYWDLWTLGHSTAFFDHSGGLSAVVYETYGRSAVRTLLWASAALFVGTHLTLKPPASPETGIAANHRLDGRAI
jgi:hypothetical protein